MFTIAHCCSVSWVLQYIPYHSDSFKIHFNITPMYTWDIQVISFLLGPCPYLHTIFYLSCVCHPSHLPWFIPNYSTTDIHICQQLAKNKLVWYKLGITITEWESKVVCAQFMLPLLSVHICTQEYKYHMVHNFKYCWSVYFYSWIMLCLFWLINVSENNPYSSLQKCDIA